MSIGLNAETDQNPESGLQSLAIEWIPSETPTVVITPPRKMKWGNIYAGIQRGLNGLGDTETQVNVIVDLNDVDTHALTYMLTNMKYANKMVQSAKAVGNIVLTSQNQFEKIMFRSFKFLNAANTGNVNMVDNREQAVEFLLGSTGSDQYAFAA